MANQKRISELPIINALSGSAVSVIPVVVGGTTNQISAERFSEFVNAYNATTSSNNFIGDQTITGDLTITGDIRAERYYIENISSSVIYESGSTLFGNSEDDVHTFTGTILLNDNAIGLGELNAQTASQDSVNLQISSTTGSINTTTSSFDSVFLQISSTTGSINTTTSSFDSVFFGISSVTGAMNTQSSSQDLVNLQISSTTGSINTTTSSFDSVFLGISVVTGSINDFTSSVLGQTTELSTITASVHFTTQSLNTQTGSQNSLNTSLGLITSSIYGEITSYNNVLGGVSSVTGAFAVELGSVDSHILGVSQQTASQDSVNLGISSVTGSLIGITNGLMAFTASLDSGYATDEQLYQLYQATRSLEIQTGSQNSINSGISAVTGAFATELGGIQNNITSFNNVFGGVSAVTGAFATELGQLQTQNTSQGLVNDGTSAVTGAFATELGGIQTTLSGHRNELDGLEAYTASLKSVSVVSGSSQITMGGDVSGTANNATVTAVQGVSLTSNIATQLVNIDTRSISIDQWGYLSEANQGISSTSSPNFVALTATNLYGAINATNGVISGSSQLPQIAELFTQNTSQLGVNLGISTFTGSLRDEVNGIEAYTASLKGAIEVNGQDVNVLGMITAQQFNVTLVSSSVMYQSGSTKFGDTSDDKHEFTGSFNVDGNTQLTGSMNISGSVSVTGVGLNSSIRLNNLTDTTGNDWHLYSLNNGNFGLYNNSDTSYVFQIDAGGNFGVASIPNTNISSDTRNIQVGGLTTIRGTADASGKQNFHTGIMYNAYPVGDNTDNAIVNNSGASYLPLKYAQVLGTHTFYTATSATADSSISWEDTFNITNTSAKLKKAGNITFNIHSDTDSVPYVALELQRGANDTWGADAYRDFRMKNDEGEFTLEYAESGTGAKPAFNYDTAGRWNFQTGSYDITTKGVTIDTNARVLITTQNNVEPLLLNRQDNDGTLVELRQANSVIGDISVSSGTVSYNPFMGSHYSEGVTNLLKGTVLETIDELVTEKYASQQRLTKVKVSDTSESPAVYGVWLGDNEQKLVAALGASWCRVNASVTVQMGDLLTSNGDGTAKVQSDDIIRSKTIGKVTSTIKVETYDDGSYLVPVVLYCG